jgi:hypothetical protein
MFQIFWHNKCNIISAILNQGLLSGANYKKSPNTNITVHILNLISKFNGNFTLTHWLGQTGPNCSPSKIFWGPCCKILMIFNPIYGHNFEYNHHKLRNFGINMRKTSHIFCGRSAIYLLQIGLWANKSDHTWNR